MMERRYSGTAVTGTGGKISGTASVTYDGTPGTEYELWPDCVERIAAGAFDDHLSTNPDVVALYNHNPDHVLGRTPDTLELRADAAGLHYSIDPPDTQTARDLLTSIARGDVRGSSFAFVPDEVQWQREGTRDVRIIKRARVYDVSPVTTPAYGSTSVGVRSEERSRLERERDETWARLAHERCMWRLEAILNQLGVHRSWPRAAPPRDQCSRAS